MGVPRLTAEGVTTGVIRRKGSRFVRNIDFTRSAEVAYWRLLCVLASDRAATRPRKPPMVYFSATPNPMDWTPTDGGVIPSRP